MPLVNLICRDGHRLLIVFCAEGPRSSDLGGDVQVKQLGWTVHTSTFLSLLRAIVKYCWVTYRSKPNVVYSFTIGPCLVAGAASWFLPFKFIPTVSGLGYAFRKFSRFRLLKILLMRVIFHNAQFIFFHNYADLRYFRRMKIVKASNSEVVNGSGLSAEERASLQISSEKRLSRVRNACDPFRVIMIARLIYEKGLEDFLGICDLCASENIRFCLVGAYDISVSDSISTELFNRIVSHESVDFLGFRSDVTELLAEFDCMLVCSRREGLSKAVIEGLASGLPVAAYRVAGVRDLVADGVNGLLATPGDIKSLARQISLFSQLGGNEYRKFTSNAALSIDQHFSADFIFSKYISKVTPGTVL